MTKTALFVVGCGRSGTSLLTRLLSFCGAGLPHQLLPANSGNPAGYWEPLLGLALNDEFLARHGSVWHDSSLALREREVCDVERREFQREIVDVLRNGFEQTEVIVIKEPRIIAVMADWLAAVTALGWKPVAIHMYRHPNGVAESLANRDGLDVRHSFALWLKYNLLSAIGTKDIPRTFVSFEAVSADWETALGAALDDLGLGLRRPAEIRDLALPFLRPNAGLGAENPSPKIELPGRWIERTLGALQIARRTPSEAQLIFDEVFEELKVVDNFFRYSLTDSQRFIKQGLEVLAKEKEAVPASGTSEVSG